MTEFKEPHPKIDPSKYKILTIKMDLDSNGEFIYDIETYQQMCQNIIDVLPSNVSVIALPPGISLEWI